MLIDLLTTFAVLLKARMTSFLGNMHFRKKIEFFVQINVSGNSTNTSRMIQHIWVTLYKSPQGMLTGDIRMPNTVRHLIGFGHRRNDTTHDIPGIQGSSEFGSEPSELLGEPIVISDAADDTQLMHPVPKGCWKPSAVYCGFAILFVELDDGDSPFKRQLIERGLGLPWFIALGHGGHGIKAGADDNLNIFDWNGGMSNLYSQEYGV